MPYQKIILCVERLKLHMKSSIYDTYRPLLVILYRAASTARHSIFSNCPVHSGLQAHSIQRMTVFVCGIKHLNQSQISILKQTEAKRASTHCADGILSGCSRKQRMKK